MTVLIIMSVSGAGAACYYVKISSLENCELNCVNYYNLLFYGCVQIKCVLNCVILGCIIVIYSEISK